jgi:hypothetical protein
MKSIFEMSKYFALPTILAQATNMSLFGNLEFWQTVISAVVSIATAYILNRKTTGRKKNYDEPPHNFD